MNPANAVTFFRIFLTPVWFVLFLQHLQSPGGALLIVLWVLFALSEASDVVDGLLARGLNLTSELGKVLDPFADVISRLTIFLALALAGAAPLWLFLVVMYRELSMTFLRVLYSQKGIMKGASLAGKAKAWVYFVASVAGLAWYSFQGGLEPGLSRDIFWWTCQGLYVLAALISVISFLQYLWGYRQLTQK